jgi:CheY-like chemotaxis protein
MNALRILHVDDEPDIREVVDMALSIDPGMTVQSCASGGDALMAAVEWLPDLILLDVMMPGMDGPATLAQLRDSPQTSGIPVVFMTARAQPRELQHFVSLGAEGVISKPFDPMTLATSVRRHIQFSSGNSNDRRQNFIERARLDAAALELEKSALADSAEAADALIRIQSIAHAIAGAAGTFGMSELSSETFRLEEVTIAAQRGVGVLSEVERALERTMSAIGRL